MYQIENKPDMASVLSSLTGVIQTFNAPMDHYLQNIGEHEICNPFKNSNWSGSTGSSGSIPDGFWETLGIRRLILEQFNRQPAPPDPWYGGIDDSSKVYGRWKR